MKKHLLRMFHGFVFLTIIMAAASGAIGVIALTILILERAWWVLLIIGVFAFAYFIGWDVEKTNKEKRP